MIIESLKVKGIGPFDKEVELFPSTLDEIVAVTGRNGVGKTFLLETISGALYCYLPFRMHKRKGKTIYDYVLKNQESYIEMVFHVADRKFRIVRNFSLNGTWEGSVWKEKTKDQTACVFEWENDKWEPKAEKVRNTLAYVEEEVCTKDVFFSAMFNSQNSAGDLVNCTVDERKKIFAGIIGMEPLQQKSELFSQRAKGMDAIIEKVGLLISSEESHVADDADLKDKIADLLGKRISVQDKIKELNEAHDAFIAAREKQETLHAQAKSDILKIDSIQEKETALGYQLQGFKDTVEKRNGIQVKIDELAEIDVRLVEVQAQVDLQAGQAHEYAKLQREIQEKLDAVSKAKQFIKNERNEVDKSIGEINRVVYTAKNQLKEWDRKVEGAALLDDLKCEADCEYVAGAREDKTWLEEKAATKVQLETDIAAAEERLVTLNLQAQEWDEKLEKKHYAQDAKKSGRALVERSNELKIELAGYDDVLAEQRKLTERRGVLDKQNYQGKLVECDSAAERIEDIENRLVDLYNERTELEEKTPETALVNYDALMASNKSEQKKLDAFLESAVREIEQYRSLMTVSKKAAFKIGIFQGRKDRYSTIKSGYSQLSEAFSRTGIQALIIDSEKSSFLNIAQELFTILSGGRLELNFSTTRELKKDKSKQETFDLKLKVEGVERDLSDASQGQQDLARIVMRAALGIYFSAKTGNRVESYFLDETTGSLDEYNREDYYEFLKHLLKYFKQIYVITHQDIAKQIPCHVHINQNHELEIT